MRADLATRVAPQTRPPYSLTYSLAYLLTLLLACLLTYLLTCLLACLLTYLGTAPSGLGHAPPPPPFETPTVTRRHVTCSPPTPHPTPPPLQVRLLALLALPLFALNGRSLRGSQPPHLIWRIAAVGTFSFFIWISISFLCAHTCTCRDAHMCICTRTCAALPCLLHLDLHLLLPQCTHTWHAPHAPKALTFALPRSRRNGALWRRPPRGACWAGPSLTDILTYLLTYLLTHLLTHLLTYLLTHSRTYLLTYLPTYLPTYLDRFVGPAGLDWKARQRTFLFLIGTSDIMPIRASTGEPTCTCRCCSRRVCVHMKGMMHCSIVNSATSSSR